MHGGVVRRAGMALALLVTLALAPSAGAKTLVSSSADLRLQGRAIPKSFLGFSQDFTVVTAETGSLQQGLNPVLVQLYRNLSAPGGGTPVLRMGGTDFDDAWWDPTRTATPPFGVKWALFPDYFKAVSRFLRAVGGKAIVGLNFAIDQPKIAVDELRAIRSIVPRRRILAYEVGNEPHVYPERPLGTRADGTVVYTRPGDYNRARYLREVEPYLQAPARLRPKPPLMAPGFCCDPWLRALPKLLRRDGSKLAMIGLHRYPLLGPKAPGDFTPTPSVLLQNDVFLGNLVPLQRAVVQARKRHKTIRISETNSITSGGVAGTSDTYTSSLWSADWLFGLAAIGTTGANFHGISPRYQAFGTAMGADGRFAAIVRPLYYGMLLFAHATPHRARLLPGTFAGAKPRHGANVHLWGTVDKVDRVVRVTAINKGGLGGPVQLKVPFGARGATVERLRAPALNATTGVTWAGQDFAFPSYDGRLVGAHVDEHVTRRAGHRYRFALPPFSAALLTVKVSRTRPDRIIR